MKKKPEAEARADKFLRGAGLDPDLIRGSKTAQATTKAALWMRLGVAFVAGLIVAGYGDLDVIKMLWGAASVVGNATTQAFDLATPVLFFWNAAISIGCVIVVFSCYVFMGRTTLFGKEWE